jgi:hypothetical protein
VVLAGKAIATIMVVLGLILVGIKSGGQTGGPG